MNLSIIILAAGQGTRMRSALPKVLHPVAGRPMLEHVVHTARALGASGIHVVYGHGGPQVLERLGHLPVHWVEQVQQLGTGHAVAQALPQVPPHHRALVLYGDVPLITPKTLKQLMDAASEDALGLLTVHLDDPTGYGRIVRDANGAVQRIVEEKDASAEEKRITETNTGMLVAPADDLRGWVAALRNHNAQGEYYLTDVIAQAVAAGMPVRTVAAPAFEEVLGVNNKAQLATVERIHQRRQAEQAMAQGATLLDPARFDVRGELEVGRDVVIDVNVVICGRVKLGDNVYVGPNCVLRDVEIASGTEIQAHSVVEEASLGPGCRIGPFARIRPGTALAEGVHVGNFVEIKKSTIARSSKVNHLSYVGDATVGARVNIGAGTITCNYDGANKFQTVIGDDVFVGSDTQLVAPVNIGDGATIGAGSTITKDAPAGELTLSRTPQVTRPGWKRPVKKPKSA